MIQFEAKKKENVDLYEDRLVRSETLCSDLC
jgi:hypothetical protein